MADPRQRRDTPGRQGRPQLQERSRPAPPVAHAFIAPGRMMALIRERTRAGLKAAVAREVEPGSPKMRARAPVAISEIRYSLNERYLHELIDGRQCALPTVERLRPHSSLGSGAASDSRNFVVGALVQRTDLGESVSDAREGGLCGWGDP